MFLFTSWHPRLRTTTLEKASLVRRASVYLRQVTKKRENPYCWIQLEAIRHRSLSSLGLVSSLRRASCLLSRSWSGSSMEIIGRLFPPVWRRMTYAIRAQYTRDRELQVDQSPISNECQDMFITCAEKPVIQKNRQKIDYVHFHTHSTLNWIRELQGKEVSIMVSMACPRYDCNEIDRIYSTRVSFVSMLLFEYGTAVCHCLSARDSLLIECSSLRCRREWTARGHRRWPLGQAKAEEHAWWLGQPVLHGDQCPWTLDASFCQLALSADVPMSTTMDMYP